MASTKLKKIDLRPTTLDLELYAGDGVSILLTITNNEGEALPVGGEITAQIRIERLDTDVQAEFAVDLTNAVDGNIVVSLSGEQTAALIVDEPTFSGVWDIQWIAEGAQPRTLVQGQVSCDADVTR
jgi:hypothetical protein